MPGLELLKSVPTAFVEEITKKTNWQLPLVAGLQVDGMMANPVESIEKVSDWVTPACEPPLELLSLVTVILLPLITAIPSLAPTLAVSGSMVPNA